MKAGLSSIYPSTTNALMDWVALLQKTCTLCRLYFQHASIALPITISYALSISFMGTKNISLNPVGLQTCFIDYSMRMGLRRLLRLLSRMCVYILQHRTQVTVGFPMISSYVYLFEVSSSCWLTKEYLYMSNGQLLCYSEDMNYISSKH